MDKIQIRTIFLFQFKLSRKAAETARDINDAFCPGTTNKRVAQRWFKKFRNGDESLEDEDDRGRPTAVDNEHLKALIEADPCKTTREVAVEIEVDHSKVVHHLKQIGKSKCWINGCRMNWTIIKKIVVLRCLLRSFCAAKTTHFSSGLWRVMDEEWIFYDNRRRSAQWLDAGEAPQHLPKPKLRQKKVMVTVWWSAAGLIHHSFLNPGETITAEKYCRKIDEMHQKLQRMCPRLLNMKGPILLQDNARPHVAQLTLQKLNELAYGTLSHPPCSPDLAPTDYHFFKHLDNFLREKCFKSLDDAESAFNDFMASITPDFYANGIKKNLFLVGKNVSILMVLISINKVYYERSYDLLKLNVKNDIIFAPT